MKTLLSVFLAVAISLQARAGEDFDKLFDKYSGNEAITTVNMTESMLQIASKFLDEDDKDAREVLASIKSVKMLISEGKTLKGFSNEALGVISAGKYEELLRVNEADERVRVAVVENGDLINDIVILIESADEVVFLNVTGDIDVNQVGKALKSLDIDLEGLNFEDLNQN